MASRLLLLSFLIGTVCHAEVTLTQVQDKLEEMYEVEQTETTRVLVGLLGNGVLDSKGQYRNLVYGNPSYIFSDKGRLVDGIFGLRKGSTLAFQDAKEELGNLGHGPRYRADIENARGNFAVIYDRKTNSNADPRLAVSVKMPGAPHLLNAQEIQQVEAAIKRSAREKGWALESVMVAFAYKKGPLQLERDFNSRLVVLNTGAASVRALIGMEKLTEAEVEVLRADMKADIKAIEAAAKNAKVNVKVPEELSKFLGCSAWLGT